LHLAHSVTRSQEREKNKTRLRAVMYLIHAGLQPGEARPKYSTNRFNGFGFL